jgi:hypothetical protein
MSKFQYVNKFVRRNGSVRYYFRRNRSSKAIPLPGLPGSEEFMAAYAAALAAVAPAAPPSSLPISKLNYEGLKALAEELGRPVTTLIALTAGNDPFYAGMPSRRSDAEWFAGIWERFGFTSGVHLRRIHYRLVSGATPIPMQNGAPYENTLECWAELSITSKSARNLRLVDPAAFVDRRNAAAVLVNLVENESAVIDLDEGDDLSWRTPR